MLRLALLSALTNLLLFIAAGAMVPACLFIYDGAIVPAAALFLGLLVPPLVPDVLLLPRLRPLEPLRPLLLPRLRALLFLPLDLPLFLTLLPRPLALLLRDDLRLLPRPLPLLLAATSTFQ